MITAYVQNKGPERERVGNERDEYGKRGVEDQEGPVAVRGWVGKRGSGG